MANLTSITTWTANDVMHFGRRAGFGISPEAATVAAAQPPAAFIDQWIDGGASTAIMDNILATRADVLPVAAVTKVNTSSADMPAITAAHGFLYYDNDAWRNKISFAEAEWLFRMQYSPNAFREKLALFWHVFFATGNDKVDSAVIMKQQIDLFRSAGLGNFTDLLVGVSKNAAMAYWLDSVLNLATTNQTPNENYGREVLELYSLGVDNGYSQEDVTNLSKALSGWSYYIAAADWVQNPTNTTDPTAGEPKTTTFAVFQGQTVPAGSRTPFNSIMSNNRVLFMHPTNASNATGGSVTITFLGTTFDYSVALPGMAPGEHVLRHITVARANQCSEYLSKRLLSHFVTPNFSSQDIQDFAAVIRSTNFQIGTALKILFKSQYFFEADKRHCLISSPVSWLVQATRMLGYGLSAADARTPKGFVAWRALVAAGGETDNYFLTSLGFALLDAVGPNGWEDHTAWLNANAVRYRLYVCSALALQETTRIGFAGDTTGQGVTLTIIPTDISQWLPVAGPTALDVFNRLVQLLQPAPIPNAVRDGWLSSLFSGPTTAINTSSLPSFEKRIRELAYLILSCPEGQLH